MEKRETKYDLFLYYLLIFSILGIGIFKTKWTANDISLWIIIDKLRLDFYLILAIPLMLFFREILGNIKTRFEILYQYLFKKSEGLDKNEINVAKNIVVVTIIDILFIGLSYMT